MPAPKQHEEDSVEAEQTEETEEGHLVVDWEDDEKVVDDRREDIQRPCKAHHAESFSSRDLDVIFILIIFVILVISMSMSSSSSTSPVAVSSPMLMLVLVRVAVVVWMVGIKEVSLRLSDGCGRWFRLHQLCQLVYDGEVSLLLQSWI